MTSTAEIYALISKGNYSSARALVDRLSASARDRPEILLLSAIANMGLGSTTIANQELDRVLHKDPTNIDANYNKALLLLNAKEFSDSIHFNTQVLRSAPNHIWALLNRGIAYAQLNVVDRAKNDFDSVLRLNADSKEAYLNRGNINLTADRFTLALRDFDEAIKIDPTYAPALKARTLALAQSGELEAAINAIKDIENKFITEFESKFLQATVLEKSGDYREASSITEALIKKYPDRNDVKYLQATILNATAETLDAIEILNKIPDNDPIFSQSLLRKGVFFFQLGNYPEAKKNFEKFLFRKKDDLEGLLNLGLTHAKLKDFVIAIRTFNRVLEISPTAHKAYDFKGQVLAEMREYESALHCFENAIGLNPDNLEALFNKAVILFDLNRLEDAARTYETIYGIDKNFRGVQGNLCHVYQKLCDWDALTKYQENLSKNLTEKRPVSPPFPILSLFDSIELQTTAADSWLKGEDSLPLLTTFKKTGSRKSGEKVKIGYFSPDLGEHAVAYLMEEVFRHHNKSKFEVHAFSWIKNPDQKTRSLKTYFDGWHDISNLCDQAAVELARSLTLDVAVDLCGFTKNSRANLFVARLAPIQVNYLGYPGSTSKNLYDYIIADEYVIPAKIRQKYEEKIIYLDCFQPLNIPEKNNNSYDDRSLISKSSNDFVFANLGANYKISRNMFISWLRILRAVPKSKLYLLAENISAQHHMLREAEKEGIDVNRLEFLPRTSREKYLDQFKRIDLFVDTFPYGSGTTARDAFLSGCPVLSLSGETFASRMAGSIATYLGLPELAVNTQSEFHNQAVVIANDPQLFHFIKTKLSSKLNELRSNSTSIITLQLESAFQKLVCGQTDDHST